MRHIIGAISSCKYMAAQAPPLHGVLSETISEVAIMEETTYELVRVDAVVSNPPISMVA